MASYHAPQEWKDWAEWLAAGLDGRSQWRLPVLMMGLVFGNGRRVVASWIRSAGLSSDYQDYYYFLQSVGRCWEELGRRVLILVLRHVLKDQPRVVAAIDDSPTKRYGPKVQGAGIHHDPTPGPSGHPLSRSGRFVARSGDQRSCSHSADAWALPVDRDPSLARAEGSWQRLKSG